MRAAGGPAGHVRSRIERGTSRNVIAQLFLPASAATAAVGNMRPASPTAAYRRTTICSASRHRAAAIDASAIDAATAVVGTSAAILIIRITIAATVVTASAIISGTTHNCAPSYRRAAIRHAASIGGSSAIGATAIASCASVGTNAAPMRNVGAPAAASTSSAPAASSACVCLCGHENGEKKCDGGSNGQYCSIRHRVPFLGCPAHAPGLMHSLTWPAIVRTDWNRYARTKMALPNDEYAGAMTSAGFTECDTRCYARVSVSRANALNGIFGTLGSVLHTTAGQGCWVRRAGSARQSGGGAT